MPIFEYKCARCGQVTEFLESAGAKVKHLCEKCKSSRMEKMFSSFAVGVKQDGSDSKCDSCSDGKCPYSRQN